MSHIRSKRCVKSVLNAAAVTEPHQCSAAALSFCPCTAFIIQEVSNCATQVLLAAGTWPRLSPPPCRTSWGRMTHAARSPFTKTRRAGFKATNRTSLQKVTLKSIMRQTERQSSWAEAQQRNPLLELSTASFNRNGPSDPPHKQTAVFT